MDAETLAKVLYEADPLIDLPPWESLESHTQEAYHQMARAALRALAPTTLCAGTASEVGDREHVEKVITGACKYHRPCAHHIDAILSMLATTRAAALERAARLVDGIGRADIAERIRALIPAPERAADATLRPKAEAKEDV